MSDPIPAWALEASGDTIVASATRGEVLAIAFARAIAAADRAGWERACESVAVEIASSIPKVPEREQAVVATLARIIERHPYDGGPRG